MKKSLVDANVWLALLAPSHEHHRVAERWFDDLAAGEAGLCRAVQLTIMRLLGNRTILGAGALSALDSWQVLASLLEDERCDFAPEPSDLDLILPSLLGYPIPTSKLVPDAYLAAFAISDSRQLVTFDGGFRQFRGLELLLLSRSTR